MPVPTYNERSGVEFAVEPEDVNGAPALPTSLHWRLVCETADVVVQDWTSVTPSTNATIEVPGTLLALQDSTNSRELFSLLVVADKDAANEYSETYEFYVRRVRRN